MTNTMRIAVVQASDGHLTCVGPNDFKADDHRDAMDAAICFHIEAGWMPAACYWVEAAIPAVPPLPVVAATVASASVPELQE